MNNISVKTGLRQIIREPTRGKHLLDLAITDIASMGASVTAPIVLPD